MECVVPKLEVACNQVKDPIKAKDKYIGALKEEMKDIPSSYCPAQCKKFGCGGASGMTESTSITLIISVTAVYLSIQNIIVPYHVQF